jgi:hypothetical protein
MHEEEGKGEVEGKEEGGDGDDNGGGDGGDDELRWRYGM